MADLERLEAARPTLGKALDAGERDSVLEVLAGYPGVDPLEAAAQVVRRALEPGPFDPYAAAHSVASALEALGRELSDPAASGESILAAWNAAGRPDLEEKESMQ